MTNQSWIDNTLQEITDSGIFKFKIPLAQASHYYWRILLVIIRLSMGSALQNYNLDSALTIKCTVSRHSISKTDFAECI